MPAEFPTTRALGATPKDRARDLHAAFVDPEVKAVFTSIGGDDQLKVLRHLDPDLLRANPKPFFGYSDSTNLLNYLWNLGIVSYHGAAVMVQLARGGRMHPETEASLRAALFDHGEFELTAQDSYTDEDRDWADDSWFDTEPVMTVSEGWTWHGAAHPVTGPAWGGCLEVLDFNLRAGRYLLPPADYAGAVLFIETSEELPSATTVYRVLMGMGERGMLERFAAVLVGRPKAWSLENPTSPAEKRRFTDDQRDAVLRALGEYNRAAPAVFGVDFGHTDPQLVIPNGGQVTVDPVQRRVRVTY